AARPGGRGADQGGAFGELAPDVLSGVDALDEVREPRAEEIGQCLDREDVAAGPGEPERARPAVVVDEAHRALAPPLLVEAPELHECEQLVVSLAKDVGGDLHHLVDLALDGIPSTIDGRSNILDDDRLLQILEQPLRIPPAGHTS